MSPSTQAVEVAQAEIVEVAEIGALLPAESAPPVFVKAPVLETPQLQFIDRFVDVPGESPQPTELRKHWKFQQSCSTMTRWLTFPW